MTADTNDVADSRSPESWSPAPTSLMIAAVLVVPAVLYMLTLYPGVGGQINPGDSAKFQFLGKILGVPHDPGYPQYMVLNHLWTRLPTPLDLARHVNALSAVFTLIAGGLIYAAIVRVSGSGMAAVLATWTLLFSSAVWTISTEAEVYSLHLAYVAGVLWAGVRWRETRQRSWLVVLIAIAVFSFGNHPLAVALLPAVLVVTVGTSPRALWSGRFAVVVAALTALSLSQYTYVWWRSHSGGVLIDGMPRNATLAEVLEVMLGGRFTSRFLLRGGLDEVLPRLQVLGGELWQLTAPAVVLAAAGLVVLMRRDWVGGVFVVLLSAVPAAFVLVYQIGDWGGYIAPVWVAVVTLAAVGLAGPLNPRVRWGMAALWVMSLVWLTASTFLTMNARANRFDQSAMLSIAEPGGVVLTYVERGFQGYRERQLNNYYRLGLGAQEQFGLDFRLARDAFERHHLYLEDRPIYFMPGPVRPYVDGYRMDYVTRETDDDPPIRYFVTSPRSARGGLRIEPVPTGGVMVTAGVQTIATAFSPVHVLVIGARDHRVKGIIPFDWGDGSIGSHPAVALLARVEPSDWVAIVTNGARSRRQGALVSRMVTTLGVTLESPPEAERTLVFVGQRSVPTGWRLLIDPERRAHVELLPGGARVTMDP